MSERAIAMAANEPTYDTGRKCKWGHVSPRITVNGKCTACTREEHQRDPERSRARCRKYYAERQASERQRKRDYYQANPERVYAAVRRWIEANRERANLLGVIASARRRVRVKSNGGTFSAADVAAVTAAQRGRCAHCRARTRLTVDHVVPLARGGANSRRNLQMLCRSCNSSKNALDPIDFARREGLLL